MRRALLAAALAAALFGGCAGARYAVRLEGWGAQVELSIDTRASEARRDANTHMEGSP